MVRKGYRDPPYHNWSHAFSVTHFCYLLLKNIQWQTYIEYVHILPGRFFDIEFSCDFIGMSHVLTACICRRMSTIEVCSCATSKVHMAACFKNNAAYMRMLVILWLKFTTRHLQLGIHFHTGHFKYICILLQTFICVYLICFYT